MRIAAGPAPAGRALLALTATSVVCLASSAQAMAARGLELGFSDPAFNTSAREEALDRAVAAGGEIVRLHIDWSRVASQPPTNPANPADPAYRFADVDSSVRAASGRGLEVVLEVSRTPSWAEGIGRPADAPAGTWRPDAAAYGQFARAVATRYGGGYSPALGQPPLPRVSRYQTWNEPNLATYLTPQGDDARSDAARIYRDLLTAFYHGVKGADPANVVITAGTAPYGGNTQSGRPRTHPVTFLRELLCLNGASLADAGCSGPVPFDVLAHHPINAGDPFDHAANPNDATTPDIDRIRGVLSEAEQRGRVLPGKHPVWVTEFWWESDPPDSTYGVREKVHARYIAEALYLFWKQRVSLVLGLQLTDSPIDQAAPGDSFQTGLWFADGRAKRALTAFRFPLVAIQTRRATKVWGRSPQAGTLRIEARRGKRWKNAALLQVGAGEVFRAKVPGRKRVRVRARVGTERSLSYRATDGA